MSLFSSVTLHLTGHLNEINGEIELTIDSCICLFVYSYCRIQTSLCFHEENDVNYQCLIKSSYLKTFEIQKHEHNAKNIDLCFPAIEVSDGSFNIAGVCAVLRWAIKYHIVRFPGHYSQSLLGFRDGCLVACSESSIWTQFCELQLPAAVKEISLQKNQNCEIRDIPEALVLLEAHLKRPVRTHNILKRKQDIAKDIKSATKISIAESENGSDSVTDALIFSGENGNNRNEEELLERLRDVAITEKSTDIVLGHRFLEGIDMTLADLIVFPCVHYLLTSLPNAGAFYLGTVIKWYRRMTSVERVREAASCLGNSTLKTDFSYESSAISRLSCPDIDKDSLYKRDPSHVKLRCKYKNPDSIITLLKSHEIIPNYSSNICTSLDWEKLPSDLHPASGDLPKKRLDRKIQQIESMVTATLKVANAGQKIVEFCAGGGHVGLLLAYHLPECQVVMIENKESSILRAMARAERLHLKNIIFYQCNLNYFKGSFGVGVSLHACGVATDLVMQQCIANSASFVCCPCCYGNVKDVHSLSYPLSRRFRGTGISYEKYALLAHFADRTEINTPTAEQGELCMGLIDTDRANYAHEHGYDVKLTTLQPLSCSPKHNLLIGIPSTKE